MSEYLTAVQERKLVAKFRQHVIALPPGSRVEWREMDAWAKSNFPVSVWVIVKETEQQERERIRNEERKAHAEVTRQILVQRFGVVE
jgi:hypothetical protein